MNTYQIAHRRSKIQMDPELLRNFETLRSTLRWRPLTANLESCEEGKFLYFRITLRLTGGGCNTYAGFSSGAPFMLTRDCLEKKKGFFLRHWVRQEADASTNLAIYSSPFMQLAVVKEVMIVRVDIDREMTLADTFKSVPFATWMFQVVQVDAMIEDAPGIRFAFAIERTVTSDERVVIMGNVEHTKQQTKIQKAASKISSQRVAPIRMPPPQQAQQGDQLHVVKQLTPTKTAVKSSTGGKRATSSRQGVQNKQIVQPRPVTIANPSGIVAKTLNPQNAVTLPAVPIAMQPRPGAVPIQNVRPRPIARANSARTQHPPAPPPGSYHLLPPQLPEKRVYHPYLKLWENRQLDDPYEPFFIVDADENTAKMNKSWRVEDSSNLSLQFNYRRLQCIPSVDYPSYFLETPDANHLGDDAQDLLIVHPLKKAKVLESSVPLAKKAGNKNKSVTPPKALPLETASLDVVMENVVAKDSCSNAPGLGSNLPASGAYRSMASSAILPRGNVPPNDRASIELPNSSASLDPSPSEGVTVASAKTDVTEPSKQALSSAVDSMAKACVPQSDPASVSELPLRSASIKTNGVHSVINPSKISTEKQAIKQPTIEDVNTSSTFGAGQDDKSSTKPEESTRIVDRSITVPMEEDNPKHTCSGLLDERNLSAPAEQGAQFDNDDGNDVASIEYITAVKAAAEYNSSLAVDRLELQSWLIEDRRIEEQRRGSRDDDDASSSSE